MTSYQKTWSVTKSRRIQKVNIEDTTSLTEVAPTKKVKAKYYCMIPVDQTTTKVAYFI